MPTTSKNVSVKVPAHLTLPQSQRILESVLLRCGCPACYSGVNISFVNAAESLELSAEEATLTLSDTPTK